MSDAENEIDVKASVQEAFNQSFLNERENVKPVEAEQQVEEPKVESKSDQPQAQPEPEVKPEPQDHRVPLQVMLDQRERAQRAERQAEEYQRQLDNLRRQIEAKNPKEDSEIPDPLIDPAAYSKYFREEIKREADAIREEQNRLRVQYFLQEANAQHGERFIAAYNALDPNDTATINRIKNSYDPGKELMRWYQQQETLRETGGDIHSFREKERQKYREELKNDPAYRAEILALARAEASKGQPIQSKIELPSITKAPTARGGGNSISSMSPQEVHASTLNLRR